jgi:hypothetical protein
MANTTWNIWNDNDGEREAPREKRPILRTLLSALAVMVVVLGVVLVASYRDGTGFDVLRHYLNYGRAEEAGGETLYTYDASAENHFALLEDCLVVLSETKLRLINAGGGDIWAKGVRMDAPMLESGGDYVLAYDVGGTELYVLDTLGELFTLETSEEEPIISARLNENGWLAVTAQESGYKGAVTVYNNEYQRVFRLNRSSTFVVDAMVSPDCKSVAVITMGQHDGRFESSLLVYRMDREDPVAEISLGNLAALELDYEKDTIWVLCESELAAVSTSDWTVNSYSFGNRYLKGCSLGGNGFALLLFGGYRAGSADQAVSISPLGEELGGMDIQGQLLSFDAAGNYLALLAGGSLKLYTTQMELYRSLDDVQGARYVALAENASAVLADRQQAWMYVPD